MCPRGQLSLHFHWLISFMTVWIQKNKNIKIKVYVYSPDIPVDFRVIIPRYWNSLFHSLVSLEGNATQFSATEATYTVPILVPPGTHYCWVNRGGVVSKLARGYYTWPALRESEPRPLDLISKIIYTITFLSCYWGIEELNPLYTSHTSVQLLVLQSSMKWYGWHPIQQLKDPHRSSQRLYR